MLIICEGTKTEPNYFNEIRQAFRIPAADVKVLPSGYGTQPLQIVNYAIDFFNDNKDYEKVYAVFDRDDHATYHDAIQRAVAHESKLKNRERKPVRFEAVASVPSFEVWFLMHFQPVNAWIHRDEIIRQLRAHIPAYAKGTRGTHALTHDRIPHATARAIACRQQNDRLPGDAIYTDVDKLVDVLHKLVAQ